MTETTLKLKLETTKEKRTKALRLLAIEFNNGLHQGKSFEAMKEMVELPFNTQIQVLQTRLNYTSEQDWN